MPSFKNGEEKNEEKLVEEEPNKSESNVENEASKNKMKAQSPAEANSPPSDQPVAIGTRFYKIFNNFKESSASSRLKRRKEGEIKVLKKKMEKRKWDFGGEYLGLADNNATQIQLDQCLERAQNDVKDIRIEIQKKEDEIEVEANMQASGAAAGDNAAAGETSPTKESKKKDKKKKNKKKESEASATPVSDDNLSIDGDQGGKTKEALTKSPKRSPKGKKKRKSKAPRNSKAAAADAAAAVGVGVEPSGFETVDEAPKASAAKSTPPKSKPPAKWKNTFAKQTRTDEADPKRWKCEENRFNGKAKYKERGIQQKWEGSVSQSIEKFQKAPDKYVALMYQADMGEWDEDEQECNIVHREGTSGWKPEGVSKDGWMAVFVQEYERCKPFPKDEFPKDFRDKYTDSMSFEGNKIHSKKILPVMPGRGMGCGDAPSLKVIGDIDPSDIFQGSVGDCWLLSGISALAEFDGAIKKLFRKTTNLLNMPTDEPNVYTVTLWDLKTFKEVDIVIDERLCAHPDGEQQLLGAKPSKDNELWVPYLEKAIAAHCGGFDKIVGGQCTHAWALLTGCKEQYTITKSSGTDMYACYGRYNAAENRWAKHGNSPHDGEPGVWPMPWPEVGGGGGSDIAKDTLFKKMVDWDKANFIVGAGTKGSSDADSTGGMVDNHAYSVIASLENVAGTGIDLLKVRNPWGKGEIEDGEFDDDGPGWNKYPQIKELLKPVVADDGIFWVTKDEFFAFFETIYVSASDMSNFLEDTDNQYD